MTITRIVSTLFSLAFVCLATFSVGQTTLNQDAGKFERLLRVVDSKYVDSVATEDLVETAIKGMLKDLDPHSVYISKKDLKRMNEPLEGNFDGVGIQFNIFKDTILVLSAISGGPSEKLGIRAGDKIVEIEGESVARTGIKNRDVIHKLRGPKGTEVEVGIKRPGLKRMLDFKIKRDKIPIYSVDATYMATPDIGYIKLNRFAATSMSEITEGMTKLKGKGMKHLILDLRGNGGGYLRTAVDLADEFLGTRELVVYTEGRSYPIDKKYATTAGNFEQGKLVVLIDEGSASASEIVSGAVQDHDRGLIIGRRSFGKGLVQKPYQLPDGSAVRLTVSRYYTPTGRCIQKPYDEGTDAYRKEVRKRFKNGELSSEDSISMPDSLKFQTLINGRTVYGGGGIMPDIFIPIDTSMASDYYSSILRKGLLNDFTLTYLDKNRKKLEKTYKTKDDFIKNFEVTPELMDKFIAHAEKSEVERNDDEIKTSSMLIKTQVKALIGRGLYKNGAYYEVTNEISDAFLMAVKVLQDDTFDNMKMQYK